MKKKVFLSILTIIALFTIVGCQSKKNESNNDNKYKDYKEITTLKEHEHTSTEILVRFDGILYGKSKGVIDYVGGLEKIGTIDKVIPNKYIPKLDNETNAKELENAGVYDKGNNSIILKYNNEFVLFEKIDETNILSINDIMDTLNNYFSKDDVDKSNIASWYTDEEKNAIIVGMMDISEEKQNELLKNCFDKETIDIIKENKMIIFEESIDTFDAKIIESKNDSITVEVLKESKAFKKGDKVTMKIKRPTKTNDFYVIGNNIRITFNGMVETSNPAQIGASKIELID